MRRIDWRPSPNIGPRRAAARPEMIILHYTGMGSAERACAWLCDPASGVSCHYLVDEAGRVTQMVDEAMRAWHAGVSSWKGQDDVNSRSIGIEIHNPGHGLGYPDFPEAQMQAVTGLCGAILRRHAIRPEMVLAHSDVAPGRKIDPGEKFDWRGLHRAGIGHWVEPVPLEAGPALRLGDGGDAVRALQALLAHYGYGIEASGHYDKAMEAVVAAFQRHFRTQRVDGLADRSTLATLDRLVAALPGL